MFLVSAFNLWEPVSQSVFDSMSLSHGAGQRNILCSPGTQGLATSSLFIKSGWSLIFRKSATIFNMQSGGGNLGLSAESEVCVSHSERPQI